MHQNIDHQPALAGFYCGEPMATHIYSEIFLHATWHTNENARILVADVESYVHQYIRSRCFDTAGVFFHGVGGIDDHIHLIVQIEPHVVISDFIGELKGASAHETNRHMGRKILSWQRGYGVVSFGRRNLPWVKEYVANQREHHRKASIFPRLESSCGESPAEAGCKEDPADYGSPI